MKKYLFGLLVVCSAALGQTDKAIGGQSYTSRKAKLTKTQGSHENQNIHCSLQDRNGNLWFGTTGEGVYRYDGKEFFQYTEKDGLSNNIVYSILEDTSGNIWFGTDDGTSLYDGNRISRVPFTQTNTTGLEKEKPLFRNTVWSIFQDKRGSIWFGTSEDLYCYDGKSFRRFLDISYAMNTEDLQLKWIQCLYEDSNGIIWMGSGPMAMEGIIRYDGKSVSSYKPNGEGWIRYILEDKDKNIWFGGRARGNFIYDGKRFINFTEKTGIGNPLLKDNNGGIWFSGEEKLGTIENEGGIWRYEGHSFRNYTAGDGIGKYFAWNMLEDKKGNIWIGTRNCGLYCYDGKSFTAFSE